MSNTLAKSTIIVTVSEIIFNVTSFLIHSVVGRMLGPADYGRYGLIVTLTTMVIILIGNGIPTAMSKYISEIFESNPPLIKVIKRQAIILQTIIIGTITILFFLSAPLLAYILHDQTLTPLFQLSTLIIPAFALASFYFSYYTGLHEFNIQSFLKISRSLFRVIFIIGLAYFFRVPGSILGYVAAPFAVFLIAALIDKFKINRKLSSLANANSVPLNFAWQKLVNYAWQIVIFFLAYELLISIDLYLVKGILQDDYLAGIYNASITLGRMPYYLFYALTVILLPAVSKSTAEKNHERTSQLISKSLRLMLILLIPTIIIMSLYARSLIKIFYSAKYIEAALPMSILVWGVGFLTVYYVLCFVMSGAGKVKVPMFISILGLILNTVLNYFLILKYGLMGSAIATSITSVIITFIMLYYLWIYFQVKIKILDFLRMMLAGAIMYAASFLFNRGEFVFILWSIILFAFYLLLLYLLRGIGKEDILYLKNSLRRKKQTNLH